MLRRRQRPWCPRGALCFFWAGCWKGRLLLHLGGLVPGCCASGACTESVTAGADGCTAGSRRMLNKKKSNCRPRGETGIATVMRLVIDLL